MAKNFGRITIDNSAFMHYDAVAIDRQASEFIFGSIVAADTLLKNISKTLKKRVNCYIESRCHATIQGQFDIEKERQNGSDFSHMTIKKKDVIDRTETNELYTFYIFYRDGDELEEILYDKIYGNTSVPILKAWIPYILENLRSLSCVRRVDVYHCYEEAPFYCLKFSMSRSGLLDIVQNGLRNGRLSISENKDVSEIMTEVTGLDMYLNVFGDILAEKIQKAFVPKFDPHQDTYTEYVNNYDDACHYGGIEIYEAQKAVIQSVVNNMNKNKTTIVVGEMGVGKTLLGAGMTYAHYGKKSGSSTIVMCPGHLVEKWQREVERLVPNSKGYIVENISELMLLEDKIKDKYKREHSFIILSKENAKFSYEKRPAAVWSKSKGCFVCPECGQTLFKEVYMGEGRRKYKIREKLKEKDFLKEYAYNIVCGNDVYKFDSEKNKNIKVPCNAKLWTPLNRFEQNSKWIKLGAEGWIMKSHFEEMYNDYFSRRETLNKKEQSFLLKLMEKKDELKETGDISSSANGVRKYSIAKYVRERLRGYVDYFIADELHEYKGDSLQGQAMGDLAMAAKKVIGLTGTLLNGYADGLFYILYRTMPEVMKAEGFEYSDEAAFQRTYGVVKRTSEHERGRNGRRGERVKTGSEKRLPGVSPLVFTKFLLENAVFVSIADMAEGLPEYTEYPLPVDMDADLNASYQELENNLRSLCSWGGGGGMKTMGALLQSLSTYPDMPYNCMPVLHPDTADVLCTPRELDKGLRNKERALIDLVKEKKAIGEKVLVYYEWTNKTDVASKLIEALNKEGIKAVDLTSKVKAKNRERWVEEQLEKNDIDVLMCNPNLVKTGLDLLEFTTIVFYQMGYNIFTMRQASRRSWRLSQTRDIEVYFMFYKETIQEQAMSLMASKLQASMALEGKFSEEGLRAMADNEDLLSQIASSVVEGIKHTVEAEVFTGKRSSNDSVIMGTKVERDRKLLAELLVESFVRKQLEYLSRETVKKSRPTSTTKLMKSLFNGKQHVANLYRPYAV